MNKKIATVLLSGSFLVPTTLYAHQVSEKMQRSYSHDKIVGKDRYETGALIAKRVNKYNRVILVNGSGAMADGLSASALAGKLDASILPIKQNEIPKPCKEIVNKASEVYIIGGINAISKKVEDSLSGKKVVRIGGSDRVETSKKIAEHLGGYSKAFIVNGYNGEADAMSVSSLSAKFKAPILLTNGNSSKHQKKSGVEYIAIGGTNVISNELVSKYNAGRIGGSDRYETNKKIIDKYYKDKDTRYFANGKTLVDALSASYMAKDFGIVLVNEKENHNLLKYKNTIQVGGMNFNVIEDDNTTDEDINGDNSGSSSGGGSGGGSGSTQSAKLDFFDESDNLDLKAYPMSKEYALQTITPYKFSVKNTGDVDLEMDLGIRVIEKSLPISKEKINLYIEDSKGNPLYDGNFKNVEDNSNSIDMNIKVLKEGSSSFKLWAWIDESANNSDIEDGKFEFRMRATGVQVIGEN